MQNSWRNSGIIWSWTYSKVQCSDTVLVIYMLCCYYCRLENSPWILWFQGKRHSTFLGKKNFSRKKISTSLPCFGLFYAQSVILSPCSEFFEMLHSNVACFFRGSLHGQFSNLCWYLMLLAGMVYFSVTWSGKHGSVSRPYCLCQ